MSGVSSHPTEPRTFRMRFLPLWLFILAVVIPVVTVLQMLRHPDLRLFALVFGLSLGAISAAGMTMALVRVFPLQLTQSGIEGFDFWNRRTRLSWEEAGHIRNLGFDGLPVLLLGNRSATSALWLPLFIEQPAQFADALQQLAGHEHALVVRLKKRLREAA
jgi:hypothetical protein